jgi:hypothetical protein
VAVKGLNHPLESIYLFKKTHLNPLCSFKNQSTYIGTAETNGLTCLPKHGRAQGNYFFWSPISRLTNTDRGAIKLLTRPLVTSAVSSKLIHSRFIPEGVAEVSQILLRDTHVSVEVKNKTIHDVNPR